MKCRVVCIIFLIFLYIFMLIPKIEEAFAVKIDLELEKDELGVTFLSLDNSESLLFSSNNHDLIVLSYLDNQDLENTLKMFGAYPLHALVYQNNFNIDLGTERIYSNLESYERKDVSVDKRDNLIYMNIKNKMMCIYENGLNENFSDCTFLYILSVDHVLKIPETVKMVIYDDTINEDYLNIYEKWIDSYQLNNREFMVLKFSDNQYDMIFIPRDT